MNFHDWHLFGYSVEAHGTQITLHLKWDYKEQPTRHHNIVFSEVAAYHFMHTDGAIITDIEKIDVGRFIGEHADFFTHSAKSLGLRSWTGDIESYKTHAISCELHVWTITSAIGFEGFIVARKVAEHQKERTDQTTESQAIGTSGISAAEQARMPEASGSI